MNIFGTANAYGGASDSGDSSYSNDELLGAYKDLTYEECRNIYRYWPLGKRIATALPKFAMSPGRRFNCGDAPKEVVDAIEKAALDLQIENAAYRCAVYSRVFGVSFIYIACEGKSPGEAIDYEDIQNLRCVFNVIDPLASGAHIAVDNDPLSITFAKPIATHIRGNPVHSKRIVAVSNDLPLYYKFNPSSFSFSGPSVFQNMTLVIRSWNRSIVALQRLATKAAAIILKVKDTAFATSAGIEAMQKNLEFIRSVENDGIAAIKSTEEVNFFAINGVNEVDVILQKLHSAIMMALSDTPTNILLDKNLSTGLADGDNDMKAILISVDGFRKDTLAPLYAFMDRYLKYKAFTPALINEMRRKYGDLYSTLSDEEILRRWCDDFSYEFNELYPQTENERADSAGKMLDNLGKIKELGGELSGIEEALNAADYFSGVDFVLDESNIQTNGSETDDNETHIDLGGENGEAPKGIDTKDTER